LKKCTVIETLEDLLIYEKHADLLRTILYAGHSPWFEDSRGRNCLHCLAEVSFDLPHETGNTSTIWESTKDAGARERYLENLRRKRRRRDEKKGEVAICVIRSMFTLSK
jgi:hypothetical protein